MPPPPPPLWDSLISSALLGAERRPFAPPQSTDAISKLLARLDTADPEKTLLGAAAAVALHRRAGRLPLVDPSPLPTPCEPDDLPPCSSRAGQHLAMMLNGQYAELLPEWLATVAEAKAGQRVPAEYLPELLDRGLSKEPLREAILAVGGKRGQWLAAQGNTWEFATEAGAETDAWQTGSRAQRAALLKQLRRRDPAQARELVKSTWPQELAQDRVAFLAVFKMGLTLADEPFLEGSLDDRAKDVRATAASLLELLPDSRLCQRTIERVSSLVTWKKSKKPGFAVTLPEECDKAMQRDGIEGKPTQGAQVIGEKSYWLSQIVSATPLAAWRQLCGGASPGEIIEAAARNKDWGALLIDGLAKAAAREAAIEWIESLLTQKKFSAPTTLFDAMPTARKEKFILALLAQQPSVKYGEPATPYLFACQHRWSRELSNTVLNALLKDLASKTIKYSYQLTSLLNIIAIHLAPAAIPEALTRIPEAVHGNSAMAKEVDKFLAMLQFRDDMLKAISS